MCSKASGLFCVCLLVSCIMNCSHCASKHSRLPKHVEADSSLEENGSKMYAQKLFNKYGQNGVLTLKGLEHMFHTLGLFSLLSLNVSSCNFCIHGSLVEDNSENAFADINRTDIKQPVYGPDENLQKISNNKVDNGSDSLVKEKPHIAEYICNYTSKCHSENENLHNHGIKSWNFKAEEVLLKLNATSSEDIITHSTFFNLCPAIVYLMDKAVASEKVIGLHEQFHHDHNHHYHHHAIYQVWLYAAISVVIISLCGLFSVAIIPVMQRICYQLVLQFLVGLAVGSLSGDALLHLFPHAFTAVVDGHESEEISNLFIWRGFAALLGIYLFYFAEQFLSLATSYRKMKQNTKVIQTQNITQALSRMADEQSRAVGEKLSHHKHGSYGYKFDPAADESLEGVNEIVFIEKKSDTPVQIVDGNDKLQKDKISSDENQVCCEDQIQPSLSDWNKTDSKCSDLNGDPVSPLQPLHVDVTYLPSDKQEPETPTEECHRETVVYNETHDDHSYVVTVTEHHDGHTHEIPKTISSVAWMVVMGDGLHNFCDGLAIGAAFAANISGGISTAIAVFCHELPHELGDFAMLLKAGMTVKQALLYNSMSSVLCLIGMIIGVSLGNITSASFWIFAGAGGMFLYIALVDMVPELAVVSGHKSETAFKQLLIQFSGIASGTTIMFLIAVYEHDLQHFIS